jgi:uncharacterized protein YlxW (UPF0749 family)
MSFWTAAFLIAIAGMIYSAWRTKHLAQIGAYEDENGAIKQVGNGRESAREKELQREVEDLRERIKVLERIATEGGDTRRLADEIEKLRDN